MPLRTAAIASFLMFDCLATVSAAVWSMSCLPDGDLPISTNAERMMWSAFMGNGDCLAGFPGLSPTCQSHHFARHHL